MKRSAGGRGLKSLKDVSEESRLRVACYMSMSDKRWSKAAWKREIMKENNSIKDEAIIMQSKGKTGEIKGESKILEGNILDKACKQAWKLVKSCFKKGTEEKKEEDYHQKEMQSEIYKKQDQKCNIWLEQNLTPKKTSAIMSMLEQMIETRAWKAARGLTESCKCRLCGDKKDTVQHLLAGCKR